MCKMWPAMNFKHSSLIITIKKKLKGQAEEGGREQMSWSKITLFIVQ